MLKHIVIALALAACIGCDGEMGDDQPDSLCCQIDRDGWTPPVIDRDAHPASDAGPDAVPTGCTEECQAPAVCMQWLNVRNELEYGCEIRCHIDQDCPDGQMCISISDGPQNVCRY